MEFSAALALRGDSAPARLGLAEALLEQEKLPEAAVQFAAYLQSPPQDQQTRYQLAAVYADLDRNDEALAELGRAEAAGLKTAAALRLRGELYLRQKKFSDAAASLEQAVALEPRDAALHARLGRARLELRDFPAAERELLAALQWKPDMTEARRDLISAYYVNENCPAALEATRELEQREPLPAGAWFVRAVCYDKLKRKAEALAAYQKFVSLDQGRSATQDFQARQRIRIIARELERKP
jgi:tetratricopeptide (TPR) repeat protein